VELGGKEVSYAGMLWRKISQSGVDPTGQGLLISQRSTHSTCGDPLLERGLCPMGEYKKRHTPKENFNEIGNTGCILLFKREFFNTKGNNHGKQGLGKVGNSSSQTEAKHPEGVFSQRKRS